MPSPRFLGTGALNHLFTSNIDSSRDAIKNDLRGKIDYDQATVFARLRVHEHNKHFVTNCAKSLMAICKDDVALLSQLVAQASKKLPDELEQEEIEDAINDPNKDIQSGNHGSAEEKKMYAPLVKLLDHITRFEDPKALRKFNKTQGMLKADEPHTFGFPSVSPDITLSPEGVDAAKSKKWRDRDAFGEVKPSNKQGPKPALPGSIPPIVTQCADYARLFMSARPFMLFCVGILIFGTQFCVGIFDRDGITFSPIHDMLKDTEIFVRVVRSLACQLSIEELGLDPTVKVLTVEETKELTEQRAEDMYPSALVSCGGRQWCTIGYPIWSSLSLLGRGSNVWRVRECVRDSDHRRSLAEDVMIMKTAWRSSARKSESDIYKSIPDPYPKGVAAFECGGDVKFPSNEFPITVRNLRNNDNQNLTTATLTPVLHRLILRTVGRPMWQYKSEKDLLTGFRDAVRAHKALCGVSILHRDISAGNVLLTAAQNGGFITDLEFARFQDSTLRKRVVVENISFIPPSPHSTGGYRIPTEATQRTHTTFETAVKVKRSACMTGTAQFMALAILRNKGAIVHEPAHDVESFIWVFSYCVMRNLLIRYNASKDVPQEAKNQGKEFRKLFSAAFSQTTFKSIGVARSHSSPALIFPEDEDVDWIIESFMSKTLVNLFVGLRDLIWAVEKPSGGGMQLTHDDLLKVVDEAIESL